VSLRPFNEQVDYELYGYLCDRRSCSRHLECNAARRCLASKPRPEQKR
jgi:hypothetical protein